MELCWETPLSHHKPPSDFLLSQLNSQRDPTCSHAHLKKKRKIKKKNKEIYLSWQDSTFRVSSTFKSYLLSVNFCSILLFQAS